MGTNSPHDGTIASIRLRKLLLFLCGAPAVVGLVLMLAEFKGLFDPGDIGITDTTLYVGALSLIAVYVLMVAITWRCPACHGYLGKEIGLARCPHCDTPFTRQAEESQS